MIELVGWISTWLLLFEYIFNSRMKYKLALLSWISGDVGYIFYNIKIDNYSHLFLCITLIIINIYGMYNVLKNEKVKI